MERIPGSSEDWGTWRARLEKVDVDSSRNAFYLHDSRKGHTQGCIETCSDLYDSFVRYHNHGIKWLPVRVQYSGTSTNGGTKQ